MDKNYSIDEIGIVSAPISLIDSRKDVNPFYDSEFSYYTLPVFVSPMTCILNKDNICKFTNKALPILPVINKPFLERIHIFDDNTNNHWIGWTAVTLDEFKEYYVNDKIFEAFDRQKIRMIPEHILIDCANGNMATLFEYARIAKAKYPKLKVMIGNISNPKTYFECCKAGIDYVRIGIGGGNGCTTSVQTGIHVSIPWILCEINKIKNEIKNYRDSYIKDYNNDLFYTKIIADGGIDDIGKAIKCLALGADYVMMGYCFAKTEESCGELDSEEFSEKHNYKHYYGQSSKQGQIDRFGYVKSIPEGTDKWIPVEYNIEEFIELFEGSLRSSMSYCNAKTLNDFIGKQEYVILSEHEFNSYNK